MTAAHVSNGTPVRINYLHKDHLGSTDVITDQTGAIVQQFSFDAFGKQRSVANWSALVNPSIPLNHSGSAIIARGYTGHEHMDEMGLIHMNGRIYDPSLGRFVQADPEIQEPFNLQNLNRYSYVVNNPLSYTDPSGYFFKSLKKYWKSIVAIAVAVFAPYAAAWAMGFGWGATGVAQFGMVYGIGGGMAVGAIAGGVAGAITTGTVRGAFTGALSGAAFGALHGLGNPSLMSAAGVGKVAAHGIVGGVMSVLQGGKFGHGFAAAGVTQAISLGGGFEAIGGTNTANTLNERLYNALAAGVVGGTTSALTGGKFGNGAVTAAFSRLLNDMAQSNSSDAVQKNAASIRRRLGQLNLNMASDRAILATYATELGYYKDYKSASVLIRSESQARIAFRNIGDDLRVISLEENLPKIKQAVHDFAVGPTGTYTAGLGLSITGLVPRLASLSSVIAGYNDQGDIQDLRGLYNDIYPDSSAGYMADLENEGLKNYGANCGRGLKC